MERGLKAKFQYRSALLDCIAKERIEKLAKTLKYHIFETDDLKRLTKDSRVFVR